MEPSFQNLNRHDLDKFSDLISCKSIKKQKYKIYNCTLATFQFFTALSMLLKISKLFTFFVNRNDI